jgi:WD40 repeat protein
VSLRFRAGATALRCVKCGTVFNPSEAAAPPKVAVIQAELSPPPPPPAPVTQRPALTVRRAPPDDRRPRRDDDRDRRRDPVREEASSLKPWLIAGGAVAASLGVILLVVLLTGRDRTTASNTEPTSPAPNLVGPTPTPPVAGPVVQKQPITVPIIPPDPDQTGTVGKRPGPGKRPTDPDPFLTPAVPQTIAQVRTFTSPALKDKDVSVSYGLDGQTLVAVTPDGDVSLVSALNGAERMSYSTGVKGFKPLVFPQGDQVATALDGKKGLFVLQIGAPIPKAPLAMPKFGDVPTTVAMSKNGEWVAAGGDQGAVVAWRKGGKELPTLFLGPGPQQRTFAGRVDALGFGDDFSAQLLAASGNTVRTWSGFDWKTTRALAAEGQVLGFPMAGRQRNTVVATVANRGLTMWEDAATGIGGAPLEGPIKEYSKAAAWGNFFDARYAALGADGKFGFWDGQRASKIEPEADQPAAADMDFNKDGNVLAVAHLDGSVGLWHVGDGFRRNPGGPKQAVRITDHGGPVTSAVWSPDGKDLATVDRTGRVRVWGGMKIDPPGSVPYVMKAP